MMAHRYPTEVAFSHKPVPAGWDLVLDADGNVKRVQRPTTDRERTPPVRGNLRRLLGVIWILSSSLALAAVIHLGPMVPAAIRCLGAALSAISI